jgi:ADP-ribosylglycohydrolase
MDRTLALSRAARSLEGLSVGDAFGECFFSIAPDPYKWEMHLSTRTPPNQHWRWTDDTAMAVGIIEVLARHGRIEQDDLAETFARRYAADDGRGYGGTARGILRALGAGRPWQEVSRGVFDSMGSMGNGGAMRAAPLGAYFAEDPQEVAEEARRSAEVTHAHLEGQAGAVAVALAAAFATTQGIQGDEQQRNAFFEFVIRYTPDSLTRAMIAQARDLPPAYAIDTAVSVLGNGSKLAAPDTVPLCMWCAASAGDFENAMWTTVSAGGDMDTNCAIVGGIIACCDWGSPPADWIKRREALPVAV